MFCKTCGKPIEDAALVCPICGAAQNDPNLPPPGLKRGQFYKNHFRCRRSLRFAGILCYAAAALTLFAVEQTLWHMALIDVVVLLFFGGLMHLFRARFAPIVLLLYGIFCLATVFLGGFLGWLPLLTAAAAIAAALLGIRGTFCFARDWKQYCIRCGKVH